MTKAVERWIGSLSQAAAMATASASSLPTSSAMQEHKSQSLAYSTSALDQPVDKPSGEQHSEGSPSEKRKFKKLTKVAGRMLLEVEQRAVAARIADGRTGPRDIRPGDILQVMCSIAAERVRESRVDSGVAGLNSAGWLHAHYARK